MPLVSTRGMIVPVAWYGTLISRSCSSYAEAQQAAGAWPHVYLAVQYLQVHLPVYWFWQGNRMCAFHGVPFLMLQHNVLTTRVRRVRQLVCKLQTIAIYVIAHNRMRAVAHSLTGCQANQIRKTAIRFPRRKQMNITV